MPNGKKCATLETTVKAVDFDKRVKNIKGKDVVKMNGEGRTKLVTSASGNLNRMIHTYIFGEPLNFGGVGVMSGVNLQKFLGGRNK